MSKETALRRGLDGGRVALFAPLDDPHRRDEVIVRFVELPGLSEADDIRLEELRSSCKLEMHPTKVGGRWAINVVAVPRG